MINLKTIEEEFDKKIDEQFMINCKDGSYIYHLTRVKEAFELRTMTFEDFREIEKNDEWLEELRENFKQFYREQIKIFLKELAGEEDNSLILDSSPKGFEKAFFKKGYNSKRQQILDKIKEI